MMKKSMKMRSRFRKRMKKEEEEGGDSQCLLQQRPTSHYIIPVSPVKADSPHHYAPVSLSDDAVEHMVRTIQVLRDPEKTPDFPGLVWAIERDQSLSHLMEVAEPCGAEIRGLFLQSHWFSNMAFAHDSAAVFGVDPERQRFVLRYLGVVFLRDLRKVPQKIRDQIDYWSRNRTGTATCMFISYVTDAVLIKVSANKGRQITMWLGGKGRTLDEGMLEAALRRV
jgi:hypothetical protein